MKNPIFPAFLCLLVILPASAADWYASSPGGVPGVPIGNGKAADTGWSLAVEYSDAGETRSLYRDGKLESRTVFLRSTGRLVAREEYDARDVRLSRVEYAYDTDGNPRGIFVTLEENPSSPVHFETDLDVNADGTVRRHSSGADGRWVISDFDKRNRPLNRTVFDEGAIASEIIWRRDDGGALREELQLTGDTEVRIRYDAAGRVLEESTARGGSLVQIRSYTWTGPNLTRVEEKGEGRTTVRELTWLRDRLVAEVRTVDGVLSSETSYSSDSNRTETLFREGTAVVRIFWEGDTRLREEFLRDGEVVRVREGGL